MESAIQYLTEKDAARMMKLALPTLRNYHHLGKGPSYFKAGRSVRYLPVDIVTYMERNRIEPGK